MKNIEMLPVSAETRERLAKLAGMHRMYGGPVIDIGAVVGSRVLVLITYADNKLSDADLVERAEELFAGEVPGMQLFYAINTPYHKHIPTSDGRHVFRIDKGPLVAEVRKDAAGQVEAGGQRYSVRIIDGEASDILRTQLEKWVQMSVNRDGVRYDEPAGPDFRAARPIGEVLEELFEQPGLPDEVRAYRSNYRRGKLGLAGQVRIVEDHTPYRCEVVCLPK